MRPLDPASRFPLKIISMAEFLALERDANRLPEHLHSLIDQEKLDNDKDARKAVSFASYVPCYTQTNCAIGVQLCAYVCV
jgi:hypothetical protein